MEFFRTCTYISHINRSTSVSSFLNRTVSFSQLNVDKEAGDDEEESSPSNSGKTSLSIFLSSHQLTSNLSRSLTNINSTVSASPHSKLLEEDSHLSISSSHLYQPRDEDSSVSLSEQTRQRARATTDDSKMEAAKGGYLGRFTSDRRGK